MNEATWMASNDPAAMLAFLTDRSLHEVTQRAVHRILDRPSDRKLRLFTCACCRQVWDEAKCQRCVGQGHLNANSGDPSCDYGRECPTCHGSSRIGGLTDPRSRRAVEVAERYADGLATLGELTPHGAAADVLQMRRWEELRDAGDIDDARTHTDLYWSALCWVACATSKEIIDGGLNGTGLIGNQRIFNTSVPPAVQASLLRDVFGNVFRPSLRRQGRHNHLFVATREPTTYTVTSRSKPTEVKETEATVWTNVEHWLAWNDGTIPKLAQAIYDERRFADMPLLADALEEAGCEDAAILGHCRGTDGAWCPKCQGMKKTETNQPFGPCTTCGGVGKLRGPHARGCFVLDLLLGKE